MDPREHGYYIVLLRRLVLLRRRLLLLLKPKHGIYFTEVHESEAMIDGFRRNFETQRRGGTPYYTQYYFGGSLL